MATPLTLYVPIKQDTNSQNAAQGIYTTFAANLRTGLAEANVVQIVHYARVCLIPNLSGKGTQAVVLITTFDGPMNPYLAFFWNDDTSVKIAVKALAAIALNPPRPPVIDLTSFENFINANNLNQPKDLYEAYPQTVSQIEQAFSHRPEVEKASTKKQTI